MKYSTDQELLPIVDGQDRAVGRATRREVHDRGLRHRAVHVLVFDKAGRIYLQLRSAAKDAHPGKWTSSASGHVDPGESYEQAARRELAEELGLGLEIAFVAKIEAGPETENEFTEVFRAVTDREPKPNPEEITEGRWFEWGEALHLAEDAERAVPSLKTVLSLASPEK